MSRVDLGVGDTTLAGKDGGLVSTARVKGPLGFDGIASVLRLQRRGRRSALIIGGHDWFEDATMVYVECEQDLWSDSDDEVE